MKRRTIHRAELLDALGELCEQLGVEPGDVASLTIRPTHLLLHTITDRDVTERIDVTGPPTVGS